MRVRRDLIQQISEDHSLVNEQIKAGMITPEEAKHSRYKNIITRSVGFEDPRDDRYRGDRHNKQPQPDEDPVQVPRQRIVLKV